MAHDIFDAVYLASDREHLVKFVLTSGQPQDRIHWHCKRIIAVLLKTKNL
jgi:hypothetical protein